MTTIESVCNQALDVIGYPRHIGNIWEGTKAARVALDAWWETRDALLSVKRPEWATKDATLGIPLKTAPSGGYAPGVPWSTSFPPIPWLYEFTIPTDCLVPLQVKSAELSLPVWRPRPTPFRITSAYTLLTNANPTIIVYTSRVLDPTLWQEDFMELMIQALAQKFSAALGKAMPQKEQKDADNSG